MFKAIDWNQIIIGLVSLVDAALWTEIAPLEPPFDSLTFTNILVWLVELILGVNAVGRLGVGLRLKK